MDGVGVHFQVPGYEGHRYELQRNGSLDAGAWISSGPVQYGSGSYGSPNPIIFDWPADTSRMFFRVALDRNSHD